MALATFARSVAAAIGSATTALPTLDALIYTGGIGEHSAAIRAAITGRLSSVGLPSELRSSDTSDDGLVACGSPAVLVVRAREDRVIAGAVAQLFPVSRLGEGRGREVARQRSGREFGAMSPPLGGRTWRPPSTIACGRVIAYPARAPSAPPVGQAE